MNSAHLAEEKADSPASHVIRQTDQTHGYAELMTALAVVYFVIKLASSFD